MTFKKHQHIVLKDLRKFFISDGNDSALCGVSVFKGLLLFSSKSSAALMSRTWSGITVLRTVL